MVMDGPLYAVRFFKSEGLRNANQEHETVYPAQQVKSSDARFNNAIIGYSE